MTLTLQQKKNIEDVLRESLRQKFKSYHPEPAVMPFHTRLLGKDRMALFSFIHSLNTNFGTAIFEPVAIALAQGRFLSVKKQQSAGTEIASGAHAVIQKIIDELTTADRLPNKPQEIEAIRKVCRTGEMQKVKLTKIDLQVVDANKAIFLIDIKAAKPNAGEFKGYKRTLLEWVAATLAINPHADVHSCLAIPYNPYAPALYNRWTMRGMIDLEHELKVAEEFWDFLGDRGAFQELLDIFEAIGIELRSEIDAYFQRHTASPKSK